MPKNEILEKAKEYCDSVRESLVNDLHVASISKIAKIPFKTSSWSIATLHRAYDLADCAYELYCEQKYVPSAIIARALMETTGTMFWLHRRIIDSIETKDIDDFHEFLKRGIMGFKGTEEFPSALNVLSGIDKIEKTYAGFREVYNNLCEFTHSNWAGTTGAYSKFIQEEMREEFGPSIRGLTWGFIPSSMCMSLMIAESCFEEIQELIPKFTLLCEEKLKTP